MNRKGWIAPIALLTLTVAGALSSGWLWRQVLAMHGLEPSLHSRSVTIPADGVTVPMEEHGGRPVVLVTINGQGPYRFILDTGAHISVVDTSLARELDLPLAPGVRAVGSGDAEAPSIVQIRKLELDAVAAKGLIAAAMPLQRFMGTDDGPRGVLSASSFPGQLVVFDYPGRKVSIRPGTLPTPNGTDVFGYGATEPLPSLPLRIAGHQARVHLDTGSADGLTLPREWLAKVPLASPAVDAGKRRTPAHEATVQRAHVKGAIELGRYALDPTMVLFGDVRAGDLQPTGSLGGQALKDFVVTLDSRNRRVRFAR